VVVLLEASRNATSPIPWRRTPMEAQEAAFLAAIAYNPEDQTTRLVFAD
jgi:hypothetical protein